MQAEKVRRLRILSKENRYRVSTPIRMFSDVILCRLQIGRGLNFLNGPFDHYEEHRERIRIDSRLGFKQC